LENAISAVRNDSSCDLRSVICCVEMVLDRLAYDAVEAVCRLSPDIPTPRLIVCCAVSVPMYKTRDGV